MTYFLVAILAILFLVAYARWFERSNIYFPYRNVEATPENTGLAYEDLYLKTPDNVKINAWFVPAEGEARGTVIFCHGNAGNIGHRLEMIRILHELGLNVLIFDYRGYGKSGGIPSENGTYLDAMAAYEYLLKREDIDKEKIIAHGKSLGGAIAVDLATEADLCAVITESAFTSVQDIGQEIYPFLPIRYITTIKYDTLSKIGELDMPKMVIHSEEDEIIPFRHGEKLFKAASEPKKFYRMKGSHNEAIMVYTGEYTQEIDMFLKDAGI